MAVGKGNGYSENPDFVPAKADIDAKSLEEGEEGAMVATDAGQHLAHVTGTLDTTGIGVPSHPDVTEVLPDKEGVADIPQMGYTDVTGEPGTVATEGEKPSEETVKEIAEDAAARVAAASGVEEDVNVIIEEVPKADTSDSGGAEGGGETKVEDLTIDELKDRLKAARQRGVEVPPYSQMNHGDLVKAVKKAEK
jgi:hypothetical protein